MKISNKAIVKIHRDMFAITQGALAKQVVRFAADPFYKVIGVVRKESKKWEKGADGAFHKVLVLEDGSVYWMDKFEGVVLRDGGVS